MRGEWLKVRMGEYLGVRACRTSQATVKTIFYSEYDRKLHIVKGITLASLKKQKT